MLDTRSREANLDVLRGRRFSMVALRQGFQAEWRVAYFRADTKIKRAVREFVLDIIPVIDCKFRTTTGDGWHILPYYRRHFSPFFIVAKFLRDMFIS